MAGEGAQHNLIDSCGLSSDTSSSAASVGGHAPRLQQRVSPAFTASSSLSIHWAKFLSSGRTSERRAEGSLTQKTPRERARITLEGGTPLLFSK
jgi:hypothetical protein